MKRTTLLLLLFVSQNSFTQEKWNTLNGSIQFEASVPFFEPIQAENQKVKVSLNTKNNSIECVAFVIDFQFPIGLMQQHFNENYVESQRYPKATFKGVISKFDLKNIDEVAKMHSISGKLTLHGQTKEMTINAMIKKNGKALEISSDFVLDPNDFKIKIPEIVATKIAEKVNTHFIAVLN